MISFYRSGARFPNNRNVFLEKITPEEKALLCATKDTWGNADGGRF